MKIYSVKPFKFNLENCNKTVDRYFPSFRKNSEIISTSTGNSTLYLKDNETIKVDKSGAISYLFSPMDSEENQTIYKDKALEIAKKYIKEHGFWRYIFKHNNCS